MDVAMQMTNQPSASSFTTSTPHASQSQSSTVSAFSSLASIPGPSSSFNSASSSYPGLSQETTGATTTTSSGSTLIDPNSPELFKQNIQIAMDQVARVNALARSALNGIQNAYQAGVNPAQTQADLTALDQAIDVLATVLRQSGVGAYPLPQAAPSDSARNAATPPTEQQLIADTARGVQQLYESFKRMQESSAVVANLLAVPENLGRTKTQ